MDAEVTGGITINNLDASTDRVVKKLFRGAPVEGINDVVVPTEAETPGAEGTPIAPITPIPAREVRDFGAPRPAVQCRLSEINAETQNEPESCSPRTPKRGVFDPFAPGPDDMLLAPKHRKTTAESRTSVARQLNFVSSCAGERSRMLGKASSGEERMSESVYGNLLDVFVPSGTEVDAVEKSTHGADSDGFKTPPLVPYLNGIPKKCPDAPMKQTRPMSRRLHIDASLCRKLEF